MRWPRWAFPRSCTRRLWVHIPRARRPGEWTSLGRPTRFRRRDTGARSRTSSGCWMCSNATTHRFGWCGSAPASASRPRRQRVPPRGHPGRARGLQHRRRACDRCRSPRTSARRASRTALGTPGALRPWRGVATSPRARVAVPVGVGAEPSARGRPLSPRCPRMATNSRRVHRSRRILSRDTPRARRRHAAASSRPRLPLTHRQVGRWRRSTGRRHLGLEVRVSS